jgi:hypothetical protein
MAKAFKDQEAKDKAVEKAKVVLEHAQEHLAEVEATEVSPE